MIHLGIFHNGRTGIYAHLHLGCTMRQHEVRVGLSFNTDSLTTRAGWFSVNRFTTVTMRGVERYRVLHLVGFDLFVAHLALTP